MGLWALVGVLTAAWGVRIVFLALHLRDLDQLWYDFERRGVRFQFARLLDYVTLAAFLGCAAWSLWKLDAKDPHRLAKFFVAWLGWSLLERLPIHRFPRTNRPGLYEQAKVNLIVQVFLTLVGAVAMTVAAWAYFWWRG